MRIETRRLADMKPADYNPRKHLEPGDPEWDKLKASIDTFGMVEPIILNEQTSHIVGGHQRYYILQAEGVEETEAVIVSLPEQEEKVLNLALNKIAGRWDSEKLAVLLDELKAEGTMELTGFEDWELDALKATYDHIDDLLKEDFADSGKEPSNFTMTFTFPEGFKETFDQWAVEHPSGKTELAQLIVNKAKGLI